MNIWKWRTVFLARSTKLGSPELTVWRDAWRRDGETNSLPGNKEVFTSKTFRTGTEIDFFIIPSNSGKVKMTWRFNLHWTIVVCIFKIHTTKYYFFYRNVKIEGMYKGMPIIWPIMTSKSVKRGVSREFIWRNLNLMRWITGTARKQWENVRRKRSSQETGWVN
jgi:hypothetical protein